MEENKFETSASSYTCKASDLYMYQHWAETNLGYRKPEAFFTLYHYLIPG